MPVHKVKAEDPAAPERTGTLTAEEKDSIAAHFAERFGVKACDFCGASSWGIGDYLVSPIMVRMDAERKGVGSELGTLVPCVFLSCVNCGNSKFFGVKFLGVLNSLFENDQ